MGISFAKSVKFGAVKFNFSGSGIGMSVGIPGLRIGTGPRGAYIAGGVAGFRYRKSLGPGKRTASSSAYVPTSPEPALATRPNYDAAPQQNILATVEHEATSVLELTDATGDALIQSMNEQRQRTSWWPFAAAAMVLVLIFLKGLSVQWPGFVMPVLMVLGIAIVAWVCWRDSMGQHGTAYGIVL